MKNKLLIILICLIYISSEGSIAQEKVDYENKIDEIIKPYNDFHLFNGTILVAKEGEIIYEKGFGKANIEWQINNDPEVKFVIGSISKSFTATLILKLVEIGKFKLEDPISKYLPEFPKEKGDRITIHHLLSNTSGIQNYFRIPGWLNGKFRKDISRDDFIKEIAKLDLQFEPGEQYLYSNSGYYLLAAIVENILKEKFNKIMDTYIFKPLGMKNSGIYSNQQLINRIANGYKVSVNGGYVNQPFINMKVFNAAGNVYTTTSDMYKWEQSLYSNTLLSKESRMKLFNPKNHYGWSIESLKIHPTKKEVSTVTYNGLIEGYSSMITRFTDKKSSVIILSNNGMNYFAKRKLTNDIAAVLYDLPNQKEKIPLSFALTKALYEGKLEQVISNYSLNKNSYSTNMDLINEIAQQQLWSGNIKKAIMIFELNAFVFKDSPTAIYQLAEAYKENNELKKAIPLYKKVLKHYPSNKYIKNILSEFKN